MIRRSQRRSRVQDKRCGHPDKQDANRGEELGERPVIKVESGGDEVRGTRCKATWGLPGLGGESACHSECERKPVEDFQRIYVFESFQCAI